MPSSTVKAAHIMRNHKIGPSVEHNIGWSSLVFSQMMCIGYLWLKQSNINGIVQCLEVLFSIPFILYPAWQLNIPKWCSCSIITVDLSFELFFGVWLCSFYKRPLPSLFCSARRIGHLAFTWFLLICVSLKGSLLFVLKVILSRGQ